MTAQVLRHLPFTRPSWTEFLFSAFGQTWPRLLARGERQREVFLPQFLSLPVTLHLKRTNKNKS